MEELMWHLGLIHADDMAGPMELYLQNHCFNSCEARFGQELCVCYPVLPLDAHDGPQQLLSKLSS